MAEPDPGEILAAAKQARRAVAFVWIAVAVALVTLWIDQGIKRAILREADEFRRLGNDLKLVLMEAHSGAGTGQAAAGSGDVPDTAGDVDDAPRTPAAAGGDAGHKVAAGRGRSGGGKAGAGGNGRRTSRSGGGRAAPVSDGVQPERDA